MWPSLAQIVKAIGNPVLIMLAIVIAALLLIIWSLIRMLKSKDVYVATLVDQLGANTTTLTRLTTLIEVLVHRGTGNVGD